MSKTVVLGVTGSVAAYRAADLARELMRHGMDVCVCLTRSAQEFVTPVLFEALTGNPALSDVFEEPVPGRMAHIDWARKADAIVIAPATANAIATLAHGQADDMLTTIVTATEAPLVVAPAMNPNMYASQSNMDNLQVLRDRGAIVVEPAEGDVACGENGQGKLASVVAIVESVESAVRRSSLLAGKTVVITAGPTHEPLDPVRFIGNRSSGKMGYALARAALQMGARVTLISGPSEETRPPKATFVQVTTAAEMLDATLAAAAQCDLLVGAAAVADFRPENLSQTKIPREGHLTLELEANPDILATVHEKHPALRIVGFSAELGENRERALAKLRAKGLTATILNDVSRNDVGFDADFNEGWLLTADERQIPIPKASKFNFAWQALEHIATLLL